MSMKNFEAMRHKFFMYRSTPISSHVIITFVYLCWFLASFFFSVL